MPMIPSTLNMNNLRITNAKFVSLHTIRKPIEYSLTNALCKGNDYSYCFESRSVLSPAQRVTGSKKVKVSVKN